MLSLLQYVSNKIFNSKNEKIDENNKESQEEENVEILLGQINDIRETEDQEQPQLNLAVDDAGCFYKTGIISHIHLNYVMIEEKYLCETKYIIPTDLKVGDKVYYLAYRINEDAELKIRKIINKIDSCWEDTGNGNDFSDFNSEQNININVDGSRTNSVHTSRTNRDHDININIQGSRTNSDHTVERKQISTRHIVGKVDKRQGRDIFLEDNTCINLDNVSSEFVPVIGDWVKLECLVELNEDIPNYKGEILEVRSILPVRQLNKLGKITSYDSVSEFGTVDKNIVFIKAVCMPGYVPFVGDKVVVQSIESDQGIQQNWRALTVVPIEDVPNKFEISAVQYKPQLPTNELNDLLKDKENIEITNDVSIDIDARQIKDIEVTIKNNGTVNQILHKCSFLSRKPQSQLTLVFPTNNEPQLLKPSDKVTYAFSCKAKFVGVSEELVIFKFKKFKIARVFRIKVNNINTDQTNSKISCKSRFKNNSNESILPETYEEGNYIRGVKPYKPAKFIPVKPVTWKIPEILWVTMNKIISERKTRTEAEYIMADTVLCLQQPLNIQNYKQRFNYLLYLEEIDQTIYMQKFDMDSATLHRSGEYLTLNVPGLVEKRPSLIIGDKVIITFKWDNTQGKKNYEGYVHKIRSSDIYLKFNPSFHEQYQGEDCQVKFKASTTVIQRCHAAVATVVNRLGSEFLFPKKVIQKEPQYNFTEEDEEDDEDEEEEKELDCKDKEILMQIPKMNTESQNEKTVNIVKSLLSQRKITWYNKQLNIYQKEAIKNILKGLARPLPYVIFGPPGTGKTITACEAILQIFFTMSESRILIATPSNSSANLIAERLLDSKKLKPGDLVRLVAHNYLDNENIPQNLLPYCATADIASEGSRTDVNLLDPRGCKTNVTLSVLCRHRIIVGTCTALGILYNMGCKPGHFTHVVIDEAGQATEPEIMIPLSLAHVNSTQVVLAGDPKQLGPVNMSRLAGYFGLNDSFLVRLLQHFPYQRDPEGFKSGYDPRLVTKLLMNYRSLPDLLDLPNKLFYEAELIPQVDAEDSEEAELLESLSDMLPKRIGGPPAIIFHSVDGLNMQDDDSPSWYNPEEATQVYIYLLGLYNHGLEPEDIGIITPYSKQVYRIRHLLAELDVELPKVGSVEEFQGQERKVIILSTVRTSEDKVRDDIRHSLGFVSSQKRLNVAITRARSLLIIIGHPKLLQKDVYWRSVLEHCASRNSCVGYNWNKK